jgi:hypothetical protein
VCVYGWLGVYGCVYVRISVCARRVKTNGIGRGDRRTMVGADGKSVTLTEAEIDIIRRVSAGQYPDAGYDPYAVRSYPQSPTRGRGDIVHTRTDVPTVHT